MTENIRKEVASAIEQMKKGWNEIEKKLTPLASDPPNAKGARALGRG